MTKRNKDNNKHNFTKDVGGGGGIRCFLQGGWGAEFEVTPLQKWINIFNNFQ